jgi:prolyl-tRNA editing enzyme YbaK/EbsC (Cys-tRNA(Pro) deacylase)
VKNVKNYGRRAQNRPARVAVNACSLQRPMLACWTACWIAWTPPTPRHLMTSYLRDQEFKLIRTSGPSHTALQCADALGAPLETVIKSVVFVASSRPAAATPAGVLVLAQGGSTVSRLALSRQLGGDWRLATPAEALALTGFEVGSIPPFGTLPTLADERILDQELVCCGAGDRDMHVMLSPADLFRATGATVGAFAFTAAIDATRISDGGEAAGGGLNGAGTGSFAISPPGTVALRAADALADRGCVGDTTGGAENIGAMKTGGGVETRGGLPVRGFVPDTGGVAVPAPLRPSASEVLSGSWTAAASASLSGFGLGSISKLASAFISKLASAFIPTGASPSIPGVGPGPISGLASTSIPGAVPAPDLGLSTCVLTLGAARANLSADAIEAELKRMAAEVAARAEAAGDAGAKSGGARAEAAGVMGGSSGGSGDASRDASVDASRDASRDASVDASRDASRDASVDVSVAWFGDESGDAPAAASGILQRLENGPSIAGVGSARLEQKTSPCIVAGVNTPPIKTPPNIAGMDTPSSIAGVGSARLESLGPHTVAGVDATPIVAGMDTPPSIAVKAPPGMSGVKSPASSSVDTLPSSPGAATPPIAAGVETDERILRHAVSSLPPLRPVVRASMRSVVAEGVCIPRALVVRVRRQARRLLFVSIQPLDPPVVSAAGGEDDAGVEAAADGQAVGQADGQARVWAAHQGVSGNEALHAVDGAMSAADTAYPTEPGVGRGVSEGQQLRASAAVSARESAYPAEESRNAEGAAAHEGVTRNGEEREAGGQLKNKGESSSWGQDVGPSRPTLPEVLESAHLCWQVIAGRTLVQNLGETSAAELLKLVRPGAVLYVEGRVQLNPRGGTHVDLVASEARVLQLAPRGGGGAAGGGVGEGGGQTMAGAVSTGEEVGSQMSAAVANGAATAMSSGVSSYAGVGSGLDATLLVGVDSCAGAVGSSGQVTDARAMPHSPPVGSTLTSPVMPTAHSASSNQGTMPTAVAGQLAEAFSRVGAAGAFNAPATSGTGEAAATPASGRLPGSTGRPPSPTSGLPRLTLPLPVTLVQDAAGVHALAEALAALPPGAQIGMDLEWRPRGLFGFPSGANRNGIENLIGSTTDFGAGPNAPALLQLATSSRVFVVDFLAVCCSGQEGAAAALYTALSRAFRSPELTKLGFAMRGDLQQVGKRGLRGRGPWGTSRGKRAVREGPGGMEGGRGRGMEGVSALFQGLISQGDLQQVRMRPRGEGYSCGRGLGPGRAMGVLPAQACPQSHLLPPPCFVARACPRTHPPSLPRS